MRAIFTAVLFLVLAIPFLLLPLDTQADFEVPDNFRGLAVLRVRSKRIPDIVYQQAVVVRGDDAQFTGLDDFGGVAFVLTFRGETLDITLPGGALATKGKRLKQILSLPLTKNEFLSIIKYRLPPKFSRTSDASGETWSKNGNAKLGITLADFMAGPMLPRYPGVISITHKQNLFELKWQSIEFQ